MDFIDQPGFITEDEIRTLSAGWHIIGSPSCSHPARFSALPERSQRDEWSRSTARLGRILIHPVSVASAPGGYYAPCVTRVAHRANIQTLFTSEPSASCWRECGCRVYWRFTVQRHTSAEEIADLVWNWSFRRQRQRMLWDLKKFAKAAGGDWYLRARRCWLQRQCRGGSHEG